MTGALFWFVCFLVFCARQTGGFAQRQAWSKNSIDISLLPPASSPGAGVKQQQHKAQRTRRNQGVLPTRRLGCGGGIAVPLHVKEF